MYKRMSSSFGAHLVSDEIPGCAVITATAWSGAQVEPVDLIQVCSGC